MGKEFQSTPPRGGRQLLHTLGRAGFPFQSTPPRGGRRALQPGDVAAGTVVSIHAPAWGATI